MALVYIPNFIVGLSKVSLIVFFFIVITSVIALVFSRQIVMNNWSTYRCNPLIIPFAGYFGHSAEESMNECLHMNMQVNSPSLFGPVMQTLDSMTSTFESAGTSMMGLNTMLGGVSSMFTSSFSNILGQLNDVGSATQYLMVKMKTIFERIAATVLLLIYSLYSILQGLLAIKNDTALEKAVEKLTGSKANA